MSKKKNDHHQGLAKLYTNPAHKYFAQDLKNSFQFFLQNNQALNLTITIYTTITMVIKKKFLYKVIIKLTFDKN